MKRAPSSFSTPELAITVGAALLLGVLLSFRFVVALLAAALILWGIRQRRCH